MKANKGMANGGIACGVKLCLKVAIAFARKEDQQFS